MRWIIRIIGFVVVLAVVAVAALLMLPADKIARIATDQISAATGREVKISGDVSMTLYPVLGVTAEGLQVGNADWAKDGPMLTAARAAIGVDAGALLGGDIVIKNVEAASPVIRLESRKDGRASWVFSDAGGAQIETTTTAGDGQPFWLERLRVTDATLIYDAEGADLVTYSGVDLALDWADRNGPAELDASLAPAGSPVRVKATINGFSDFLNGAVQPVAVVLGAGGGEARLTGRANLAGAVAGAMALELPKTNAFLRALDLPGVELPRGLGQSIKASAEVTLTEDRQLSLRKLDADLGGNELAGDVDVSLNGVPYVKAKLRTGALNLSGLGGSSQGGGGSGGGAAASGAGWPSAPLDASGLAAFNGSISLAAASIDLGTLKLGKTSALVVNDRSRLVFTLREAAAYDGQLTGELVANNRNGLSVGGNLKGRGLQMQGLLSDLAGITRLSGAADAELKFLGVGQSVREIMNSLSGQGGVRLGRGTISGIDLDALMRSGNGSGRTTVFDSLTGRFAMKGGVLRNDDLLLLLPNFEARGAGRVGLGAQDLDYLFTPKALRGNEGRGIAIPVRIKGPWAGPRIVPDLEAAIDLNFKEERKKLENRVKEEVKDEVAKTLGVDRQEGQSLQDAVEEKLQDELKKGLRRLFD